jgi:5-formyltetrahydrofolate cyclo-ligase
LTLSQLRQVRRQLRDARRALDPSTQLDHAEQVARAVINSGALLRCSVCAAYLAHPPEGELDTWPLLSRLWSMGKTVGCPVIDTNTAMDNQMELYRLTPSTHLVRNRYDMLEPGTRGTGAGTYLNPLAVSLLFMPLVGFDSAGTRLGMGAGYYDRYIGRLLPASRPLLVGLAHDVQRSRSLITRQPWDIPLDAVVTESGWQTFSLRARV